MGIGFMRGEGGHWFLAIFGGILFFYHKLRPRFSWGIVGSPSINGGHWFPVDLGGIGSLKGYEGHWFSERGWG